MRAAKAGVVCVAVQIAVPACTKRKKDVQAPHTHNQKPNTQFVFYRILVFFRNSYPVTESLHVRYGAAERFCAGGAASTAVTIPTPLPRVPSLL